MLVFLAWGMGCMGSHDQRRRNRRQVLPGVEAWEAEKFGRCAGFEGSTVIWMEGSWRQLELRLASGSEAHRCQGKPGGVCGVVRSRPRALARSRQHVGRGGSKKPMQGAEDRPAPLLLFLFIFSNGNSVLFLFKNLNTQPSSLRKAS